MEKNTVRRVPNKYINHNVKTITIQVTLSDKRYKILDGLKQSGWVTIYNKLNNKKSRFYQSGLILKIVVSVY